MAVSYVDPLVSAEPIDYSAVALVDVLDLPGVMSIATLGDYDHCTSVSCAVAKRNSFGVLHMALVSKILNDLAYAAYSSAPVSSMAVAIVCRCTLSAASSLQTSKPLASIDGVAYVDDAVKTA